MYENSNLLQNKMTNVLFDCLSMTYLPIFFNKDHFYGKYVLTYIANIYAAIVNIYIILAVYTETIKI